MTSAAARVSRLDRAVTSARMSSPPRELEILTLLAEGKSNKLIARELNISEGTVKTHVKNILEKLDATSRAETLSLAARRGLIKL
jgi:DNA-binding NarL/FixJ family response regulator